jgi:hypothetical protein
MKLALSLLLAAGLAGAQTLDKVAGVSLEGEPWDPTIVNGTGKAIMGWVVLFTDYKSTTRFATHSALFINPGEGIPPGGKMNLIQPGLGKLSVGIVANDQTIKRTSLDAVIFADGSFVGPDGAGNFDAMQQRMTKDRHIESDETKGRIEFAKETGDQDEVQRLTKYYYALPELHKEKQ